MKIKNINDDFKQLENQIEEGLVTAHEYKDPNIFLPYNPLFQIIKKIYLKILSMYTKYQIVFNKNLFYSTYKTYQYILQLKSELKKQKEEIALLKKQIKNLIKSNK